MSEEQIIAEAKRDGIPVLVCYWCYTIRHTHIVRCPGMWGKDPCRNTQISGMGHMPWEMCSPEHRQEYIDHQLTTLPRESEATVNAL